MSGRLRLCSPVEQVTNSIQPAPQNSIAAIKQTGWNEPLHHSLALSTLGILDTITGKITQLPSDSSSDHHSAAWSRDGSIMVARSGMRSTIWKFQPQRR